MDLIELENHPLARAVPLKMPVEFYVDGEIGPHPSLPEVTGKIVTIVIEKKFNKFERVLAKIFRAPPHLKRVLDHKNSLLWELIDGERDFLSICRYMDQTYNEDVAPVGQRVAMGLKTFERLRLIRIYYREEE